MPSPATKKRPPSLVSLPDAAQIQRQLAEQSTRPTLAVFFHTRGQHDRNLSLITAHRVAAGPKGKVQVQAGRPLSPEDEMEILQLLRPRDSSDGFRVLPPNLLHASTTETMWWLPPTRRPMILLSRDDGGQPRSREVMWPSLVLLASQQRLYVVACRGSERPTEDTPLHHAPLANIWSNAQVCTGTALLPNSCGVESVAGWTAVLTDTAFTHSNHGDVLADTDPTSAKGRHDPMQWWSTATHDAIPDDVLVPLGFTLRDFIDFTRSVGRR